MSDKDDRTPDFEASGGEINLAEVPTDLAILPLRDTILFPHAILPLAVARESSVALVQMKADTLGRIDEALRRLEAGTYGQCAECGREIPEARLKALPFAVLCREDQEQEESREAEEKQTVLRAFPALEG